VQPDFVWFVPVLKLWGFYYFSGFPDDAGMIIVEICCGFNFIKFAAMFGFSEVFGCCRSLVFLPYD
jgi:hypothetical protein